MARDIKQLHPRLQAIIPKLMDECARQGVPIKIGECLRSVAEQNAEYAKGRTAPGVIVTRARGTDYDSQHQWGIACDFYLDFDVDGDGAKADDAFNNANRGFEKVGAIALSIGLGWGGTWTSPIDRPHLYLPDWGDTPKKLKELYGVPEKFMATWGGTSTTPVVHKPTPTPTASKLQVKVKGVNKGSNLMIRKGPSKGYAVVGKLAYNDPKIYTVVEVQNGWGRIDGLGWICLDYTETIITTATKKGSGYMFEPNIVKNGSTGLSVLLLQEILKARGYKGADGKALVLDRVAGNNTIHAINAYQSERRSMGMELGTNGKNDGICGKKMWRDLIAL